MHSNNNRHSIDSDNNRYSIHSSISGGRVLRPRGAVRGGRRPSVITIHRYCHYYNYHYTVYYYAYHYTDCYYHDYYYTLLLSLL